MDKELVVFYVDGQSQGNEQNSLPRKARIAVAYAESADAHDPGKFKVFWQPLGDRTNNEAEYYALLKALAMIKERWAEETTGRIPSSVGQILIRSDSQLVVNQVNGDWRVEDSKLIELSETARDSIEKLGDVRLEWIPREENFAGLWLEGKLKPLSIERVSG
jgi:ribonuclease HI